MASEQLDQEFQGKQDRGNDHRPFDEDVIAPVLWKRRVGFGHRAISQVVPSLESLITTPIAASSSRMRSDSLKSLRARGAVRNQGIDLLRIDTAGPLLAILPFRLALGEEPEQPKRRGKLAACLLVS